MLRETNETKATINFAYKRKVIRIGVIDCPHSAVPSHIYIPGKTNNAKKHKNLAKDALLCCCILLLLYPSQQQCQQENGTLHNTTADLCYRNVNNLTAIVVQRSGRPKKKSNYGVRSYSIYKYSRKRIIEPMAACANTNFKTKNLVPL